MPWVLVPLVAIVAWMFTEMAKHRSAGGAPELEAIIRELAAQLDDAEEERERLQRRVENLEAIVTSEHYELEQEASAALRTPLLDQPEHAPEAERDEDRAAALAQRLRQRS